MAVGKWTQRRPRKFKRKAEGHVEPEQTEWAGRSLGSFGRSARPEADPRGVSFDVGALCHLAKVASHPSLS